MPFVNIRILNEHSQERKNEISRCVTEVISDVTKLPPDAIWVVFEDFTDENWWVGGKTVKAIRSGKS